MKTALAMVITAVALAAGCLLIGYAYSEWWQAKPLVRVEGWVIDTTDEISGRDYAGPETDIITTARLESIGGWEGYFDGGLKPVTEIGEDRQRVGTIVFEFYSAELPGRTREISVYDLRPVHKPGIRMIYSLYVEPGVALPSRLDALGRRARYVAGWSVAPEGERRAWEFESDSGPRAMTAAADLMWHIDRPRREKWLEEYRRRGEPLMMFQ